MIILGIETSCDDTAAAVVRDGHDVLSSVVSSQDTFHAAFAGVVPEIASRKHLETIHFVVRQALSRAGISWDDVDRMAVTNRPGLVGSLLVGVSTAKAYAWAHGIPLVAVNHIAAHLYAPFLGREAVYPTAGLIVSGGHTLLVRAENPLQLHILGSTIDDAVGEAYDKVAKHFGLGYPGGPLIDRMAGTGDPQAFRFPRTLLDAERQRYDFSFSGIKTAVIHQRDRFRRGDGPERIEDILASFQVAVVDVLEQKAAWLMNDCAYSTLVVSGGVAANSCLRERFAARSDFLTLFPERRYCTDNAAMVAGVAFHAREGLQGRDLLQLDITSRIVERGKRRRQVPPEAQSPIRSGH